MLELILVRHGESHGNLDRSLGTDTELTELGREQATRLGRWLAGQGYKFSAIYCSTLQRARQTAALINLYFDLEITFDPDLRETEHPYLGQLPRRAGPLDPDLQPTSSPAYESFRERVMRATARILQENDKGCVLVIAHAGTLGTMIRGILGVQAMLIGTEKTGVHNLRWVDGRWQLQYANHQEHLLEPNTDS